MDPIRRLIPRRPAPAALIAAAALLLRLAVPAGFMPVLGHNRVIVAICHGTGPATMAMATVGMTHHDQEEEAPRAGGKCAFADLAKSMTGGAHPVLLAAALVAAVLLALFAAPRPSLRAAVRLRPPVTRPPLPA